MKHTIAYNPVFIKLTILEFNLLHTLYVLFKMLLTNCVTNV
jgi:hypothetical protein